MQFLHRKFVVHGALFSSVGRSVGSIDRTHLMCVCSRCPKVHHMFALCSPTVRNVRCPCNVLGARASAKWHNEFEMRESCVHWAIVQCVDGVCCACCAHQTGYTHMHYRSHCARAIKKLIYRLMNY